ncbi:porin [Caldimonas sp. KR1-144]|uniref:porin n=1 Tax=Caldimonas sp. KR1-144 TaxID=3400911 RepID=UPI003C0CE2AE
MKKTLIALAVLAAAGAASAQSSVTLYGRIDANVTYQDPGSSASVAGGAPGDAVIKMNDGGDNGVGGSRWGLRGTEDLGGGLKAYFVLESGFRTDTGAGSTPFFNRQAYVALGSKDFGDIRLGRQQTLTRELNLGFTDVSGESELSVVETLLSATSPAPSAILFQNLGTRVDNAVQYLSPVWGGFQVRAIVAAGEGTPATNQRLQGVSATFASGPLKVGAVFEQYDGWNDVVTVGGNYNFGVATVFAGYQQTKDVGTQTAQWTLGGDSVDQKAYNLGVLIPFGAFELRGQYTSSTIETALGDADFQKYGVSLRYSLSKRTQLYAAATQRKGDDNADEFFSRKSEYVFGIGHNF